MNKSISVRAYALICFVSLTCHNSLFSQGEIPVDMHTGTPIITVPICAVTDRELAQPITLVYDVAGLKITEMPDGKYGLGWNLSTGGSISRQVKGLPDDLYESNGRKGWLHQNGSSVTNATEIYNFVPASDGDPATTSDETADYAKMTSFDDKMDTEPDVFHFQAGEYSGSFFFDNSSTPQIRITPYQDIKITCTISSYNISAFTITTNTGVVYNFSMPLSTTRKAVINPDITEVSLLKRQYEYYKTPVTFFSQWELASVTSPFGAHIDYSYTPETIQTAVPIRIGVFTKSDVNLTQVRPKLLYTLEETISRFNTYSITASSGSQVVFEYLNGSLTNIKYNDSRKEVPLVKEIMFLYSTAPGRKFLSSVTETSNCQKSMPYKFTYWSMLAEATQYMNAKDYWGYYNGQETELPADRVHSFPKLYLYPDEPEAHQVRLYPIPNYAGTEVVLNGANRTPSPEYMKMGALNGITYPTGGKTEIQYEANTFWDAKANMNQYAGGLRVKSISYYDGVKPGALTQKNFAYVDASGHSSGRIVSFPAFLSVTWRFKDGNYFNNSSYDLAFSTSYTKQEQWKSYTLRAETDLNELSTIGEPPVRYEIVTVSRPGSGSSKFEYLIPAQYGSTAIDKWAPTSKYFARPSGAPTMALITSAYTMQYPFSPHTNYELERGLLSKQYEYNEAGTLVKLTQNNYTDLFKLGLSQPTKVYGLSYDRYPNSSNSIFLFGKYFLLADYAKVLSSQTVTLYENGSPAMQSVEYFYESAYHKLLTRTKSTSIDGTIYTTKVRYPLDFGTIPANPDASLAAIKNLQDNNRNGVPLEVISKIQKPGDTEKTIGASFNRYENFAGVGVLPKEGLRLAIDAPISNYAVGAITGTALDLDDRFESGGQINSYTSFAQPITVIGNNRVPVTTVYGYSNTIPVAEVVNSSGGDFSFSDFETTTGREFTVTNAFYGDGRTGSKAIHPYATLTSSLSKAPVNKYVISLWLKSDNTTPVIMRVKLKSTDLATTYYNDTIKVIPRAGEFKFYKKYISVTNVPASFTFEMVGEGLSAPSASSPGLVPVIDDVSFYPENASITSSAYQIPYGATATTSHSNGVSSFQTFDNLGRPKLALDQDKNIRSRVTYNEPVEGYSLVANFSTPITLYTTDPMTFTATDNPCVANVSYSWDFGTGSFTAGTRVMSHIFSAEGKYTVKLRVQDNTTLLAETQLEVDVEPLPLAVALCKKGIKEFGCSTISTFEGCGSITSNNPTFAYFRVNFTDYFPSNPTYQWKRRNVGDATWVTVGTNSIQYDYKVLPNSPSVEIMCEVTAAGMKGVTSIETITVYPCN